MPTKKFYIAGVQHHEMHKVLKDLKVGDELELVPEPTNKFDPNAIRIELDAAGQQLMLGYVPKKFSAEVSAMIEVGQDLLCAISHLNKQGKPWEWCEVTITTEGKPEEEEEDEDLTDEELYGGPRE